MQERKVRESKLIMQQEKFETFETCMKGFVPTPDNIVDLMVDKLFAQSIPEKGDMILDPGCGKGAFIDGIIRWCLKNQNPIPKIVGIESDPRHIPEASKRFKRYPSIEIKHQDFLLNDQDCYDYIIGNPPYVPITKLSVNERTFYKKQFWAAQGRFDLYLLFFEKALKSLKHNGKLVFITPEKFMYVASASRLRELIGTFQRLEIQMVKEEIFGDLTTYPTITTIVNQPEKSDTRINFRDGRIKSVKLPADGRSWLPEINGIRVSEKSAVLSDIAIRISCGVATGADPVFVKKTKDLSTELLEFAYPTVSGRELILGEQPIPKHSMLVPYLKNGTLVPENELRGLTDYLKEPNILRKLKNRTCVARKPWYAFHENPPLVDILKPKILCKDITAKAHFWIDKEGGIVPRHSVYYIVPKDPKQIKPLCDYLNSEYVSSWLEANCQKAANDFLRLQSAALKHIPIPLNLSEDVSL